MDPVPTAGLKAMVLSAGYGTRLGELTRRHPKPMLSLAGRPLLEYILRNLAAHGFHEIAVNLHFMPERIRDYFGDGSKLGLRLTYSYEEELLGTAGGVKKMATFLGTGEAFLVHYGDVITDQDLGAMRQFHSQKNALATLLVHRRAQSNSVVDLDNEGRIVRFLERPNERLRPKTSSTWVNSGICVCDREILQRIPAAEPCDLPRDIFTCLVGTGRLFGFPLSGYRCAIDSPERLAQAREAVNDQRCRVYCRRRHGVAGDTVP